MIGVHRCMSASTKWVPSMFPFQDKRSIVASSTRTSCASSEESSPSQQRSDASNPLRQRFVLGRSRVSLMAGTGNSQAHAPVNENFIVAHSEVKWALTRSASLGGGVNCGKSNCTDHPAAASKVTIRKRQIPRFGPSVCSHVLQEPGFAGVLNVFKRSSTSSYSYIVEMVFTATQLLTVFGGAG